MASMDVVPFFVGFYILLHPLLGLLGVLFA
jgi:hypothetical protein